MSARQAPSAFSILYFAAITSGGNFTATILGPHNGAWKTLAVRVPVPTCGIQRTNVLGVVLTLGICTGNDYIRTRNIG
jgi:hypothetical protein